MEAVPGVILFTLGFYVVIYILFQVFFTGLGHYKLPTIHKDGKLGSLFSGDFKYYKNSLKLTWDSFKIIYKSKTWVLSNHLGIEQALYLYYQTEALKLMIILCIVQLGVMILSAMFLRVSIKYAFRRYLGLSSHFRLNSWGFNTFNQTIVTLFFTYFCIKMRRMTIQLNYEKIKISEKVKDKKRATWHQLRTLEITGGLESDFPGKAISKVIQAIMDKHEVRGKLLSVKAVPSLEKVVLIEKKREVMLQSFKLRETRKCGTCCVKKCFYDPKEMNKQLLTYNRETKKFLRNIKCSSHVFCLFDTPETACKVKRLIKKQPEVDIDFLLGTKQKRVMRHGESFVMKNVLNQDSKIYDYDKTQLGVTHMPHVLDILWRNMSPKEFTTYLRKCIIYSVLVLMLIFVSTPAAMLQGLRKSASVMNYLLTFQWIVALPGSIQLFLRDYFTTLTISGLNALAAEMIDYLACWQYYTRLSRYHSFVMTNMMFYFTVNMILMPGITLSSDNTIFNAFQTNKHLNFTEFMEDFYLKDSGEFFFILIIQKASLSFANTFLRIPDLFKYFSLKAAHKYRDALRRKLYYKNEFDCFPYGYYYAMNCSIMNIITLFCVYVPVLTFAGVLYYFFRLINDGIAFFCVYERDFEGNGVMTYNAVKYTQIGILMSHIFLVLSCFLRNEPLAGFVNLFILIISSYIHYLFTKNPISFKNIIKISKDLKSERPTKRDVERWIEVYTHPIMKLTKYFYAYKKNFESPMKKMSRSESQGSKSSEEKNSFFKFEKMSEENANQTVAKTNKNSVQINRKSFNSSTRKQLHKEMGIIASPTRKQKIEFFKSNSMSLDLKKDSIIVPKSDELEMLKIEKSKKKKLKEKQTVKIKNSKRKRKALFNVKQNSLNTVVTPSSSEDYESGETSNEMRPEIVFRSSMIESESKIGNGSSVERSELGIEASFTKDFAKNKEKFDFFEDEL